MTQASEEVSVVTVPPLTRNSYIRSTEVEDGIRATCSLSRERLIKRVQVRDKNHSTFIAEEVVVFLIREYHLRGDTCMVRQLSDALVRRVTGAISAWLWEIGFRPDDADDALNEATQEALVRLFAGSPVRGDEERREGGILDLESDKSDFAQVRFWRFLRLRALDAARAVGVARGRRNKGVDLSDVAGHAASDDAAHGGHVPLDDWDALSPWKTLEKQHEDDALQAAVRQLPNSPLPLRDVTRLRYFEHWQIESSDEADITLSTHFGRTPRTIRDWLRKAEAFLGDILQKS